MRLLVKTRYKVTMESENQKTAYWNTSSLDTNLTRCYSVSRWVNMDVRNLRMEMHSVEEMNFGLFLKKKRLENGMSLRQFASEIDLTASYISDVEKTRRNPISHLEKLREIAELLKMSNEERTKFFDLAGQGYTGENTVSPDLPDYIMSEEKVRIALRKAKKRANGDKDGVDKMWQEMIDKLGD